MKNDTNPSIVDISKKVTPSKQAIRQEFEASAQARYLAAKDIEIRLEKVLSSLASIPTVKIRLKKFESLYKKYRSLVKSGKHASRITDLMGIRIVCPFIKDMATVEDLLKQHFKVVEIERKMHSSFNEFGYESTHLLIEIPADIADKHGPTGCDVAEIQIRTILQDAWAEVEHEIFYKAEFSPVDEPMKRKLAAVNASLALADIVFQEIRDYQKQLSGQLGKRRATFYQKIEDATDALLFSEVPGKNSTQPQAIIFDLDSNSIDDLLLKALKAHNENRFKDAIAVYTRILELKPDKMISSLIYKHRGMANFAQSKYQDAITDFTQALDMDANSYRVAYYRGVVHSVLRQYAEAIDDFTRSLEINPYQEYCMFRRGQAFYHIGDYPQALSDCEASLAMEPQNETVTKFRELIQNKLKM